jgi:catechol 2,3-dioxygenase-like lactoylglutathione lyase family enzyme
MMFAAGYSELVLVVPDVMKTMQFYRDVVKLTLEEEPSDEWAWFFVGDPELQQRLALRKGKLLFEERSPHPAGKRWGQVHFALRVPRTQLDAAVAHVRAKDVEVHGPSRFDWMAATSYYFYDPAGNLVEFWSPDE